MKLHLFAAAVAASGAWLLPAGETNLLRNVDFNNDGLDGVLNWQNTAGFEVIKGAGPAGSNVMRIELKNRAVYFRQESITLAPGEPHSFGAWVRTRGLKGTKARLVFYNAGWRISESIYLPLDTAGEWRKLEWSGKIMPNPRYNYALHMASPAEDGCIEFAAPFLYALNDTARAAAVMAPEATRIKARIVPINPRLTQIAARNGKMEFYYPGAFDSNIADYDLIATIDGREVARGTFDARARQTLNLGDNQPGKHTLGVKIAERATGRTLAENTYTMTAIDTASLPAGRRLNNFVTELYSDRLEDGTVEFCNPRDGWVYILFEDAEKGASGRINFEPLSAVRHRTNEPTGAMRNLPAGRHTVKVTGSNGKGRLRIHAVKPMVISPTCGRPPYTDFNAQEFGSDYYRRYLYHTFNTFSYFKISRNPDPAYPADTERMRDIVERGFGANGQGRISGGSKIWSSKTELTREITKNPSWIDGYGLLLDESSPYSPRHNQFATAETCWELAEDPRSVSLFWNSCMYATCRDPRGQASMLSAIANSGRGTGMILPETYLISYPTEEQVRAQERHYAKLLGSIRNQVPAAASSVIFCFGGYLIAGGWNGYSAPDTDMKTVIDDFIRNLAINPDFADAGGIGFYAIGCNHEIFRWYMDTIRHYAILGNTARRSDEFGFTYKPGHITDNDFERGFEGWKVEAAEPGSIKEFKRLDYGRFVIGRKMVPQGYGDTALVFERSAKRPNKVSQTMKNLIPGKCYFVSCATMDLDDLKKPGPSGDDIVFNVSVGKGGVEIPQLRATLKTAEHRDAKWQAKWAKSPSRVCATHSMVFKATATEAELTLSDWKSDAERGGGIGRKRIVNYVIVRPYYEEKPMIADLSGAETVGKPPVCSSGRQLPPLEFLPSADCDAAKILQRHGYRPTGEIAVWQPPAAKRHPALAMFNSSAAAIRGTADYLGGRPEFDRLERYSDLSLKCLRSDRIILATKPEHLDQMTLSMLINDEMLAVHQDASCAPAKEFAVEGGVAVVKRLTGGDVAVGLFNMNDDLYDKRVEFNLADAGFSGKVKVRDLWRNCDLGEFTGSMELATPRHGCHVFRLSAVRP